LRDYLAAERTFLAWIRTGLALIGFGFVVACFGLFLQSLQIMRSFTAAQTYGISLWLQKTDCGETCEARAENLHS